MKTALAIRHVHFENLGVLEPLLSSAGFSVRYCEAGLDDISQSGGETADLLVVLGAPIGAYEEELYPFLNDTLHILENRLGASRPTIGICLGAQLMARALGARVYPGLAREIGWSKLVLDDAGRAGALRHLEDVPVLHWHGDTFDLPQGATRLASTGLTPNQAFSYGAHALGLQFHAEVMAKDFEAWLIGHACEIAGTGLSVNKLRADMKRHAAKTAEQARLLFGEWLKYHFATQPKVNAKA